MDIPYHIMKPARYAGIEPNRIVKDPDKVKARFALCYPDIYEVGMSYYGLFLLYELMNARELTWCERCFAPWHDFDLYLKEKGLPLMTLESHTPLNLMDAVGFSLSYELNVTNVLNMLSLGGIPLRAEERETGPIVIGGGPLMLNPKPFEGFFDIIVIGEADEVLMDILGILETSRGMKRSDVVKALAALEGVYSPLFPKERVKRLFVKDLDASFHPTCPAIPIVGSIHNRLNIEVSRGCGNGCRFCLAGFGYRPYRERSFETVTAIIDEAVKRTGYEEISLLSLSTGDFTGLFQTISYIKEHHKGVSVALPSLKIGSIGEEEIRTMGDIARTGLTFALESASSEIRCRINKNIDLDALVSLLPVLRKNGWRKLKLYFMVGFPWEREEDIEVIRDLIMPFEKAGMGINLAVSPFIPKPHTPFQRLAMDGEDVLAEKMLMVKKALRKKNVSVKFRDARVSALEALISRGDGRLSSLFEHLVKQGAKLEAWREFFRPELYDEWFLSEGVAKETYIGPRSGDERLPWSFIDTGVEEDFLEREAEKAGRGESTPDCYTGCEACGMGCEKSRSTFNIQHSTLQTKFGEPVSTKETVELTSHLSPLTSFKYTFRYGKYGDARLIGHLDTMGIMLRALRSAGISIKMHGKYHPMPKISLSDALPMGIESTCELIEVETDRRLPVDGSLVEEINRILPRGMRVFECNEGSLKGEMGAHVFLLVSDGPADREGFIRKNMGNLYFYVGIDRKGIKELWKTGMFKRIIRVEAKRIHGIRIDH